MGNTQRRRARLHVVLAVLAVIVPRIGLSAAGAETSARKNPQWVTLDQRPGEGEQCLVCRKRIFGDDVVEIRYQGRTFHVGAVFLKDFAADPQRYFSNMQARSALFDENALRARPMATGWLWFGVYVLAGLIFAAVCGYVAVSRALSPIPWFFAGLVGNVAGLVVLLVTPRGDERQLPAGIPRGLRKVPLTRAPVRCASCGAMNHPAAQGCSDCGAGLEPAVESEARRV